ncbi:HIRAN domain-containing protein [Clostridium vincentii]|uniref:HIRAN domain-containing protein n=1 Tax=Clostridium vincentii TaxID=52704 RepID=A0A2T0BBL4_9CLOT|nr:HIRAN domain-containing protein [Clostridium vincentii]PRR81289.1 hypothetical protein CLVI_26080 [Clostridium vincentii]
MSRIFEEIKEAKALDANSGNFELLYLYSYENISIGEELELAQELINEILLIYNEDNFKFNSSLEKIPLIYYMNSISNKLNLLVKEDIIEEKWLIELTNNLIYKGERPWEVKLGLILAKNYLPNEKLLEVVQTFSKSGEYIFYLLNTIRNLKGYNSYLFNLAKNSKGVVKVFAITNMEMIKDDIILYLLEDGYKDDEYEDFLISYIFTGIKLENYMKNIDKENLERFSSLLCNYLRGQEYSNLNAKHEFLERYIPKVFEIGEDFYSLEALLLMKQAIVDDKGINSNNPNLEYYITEFLEKKTWEKIFLDGMKEGKGYCKSIILMADFYEYELDFNDFVPYLNADPKDYEGYYYVINSGNKEDILKLLEFFKKNFNIEELTRNPEDITKDMLDSHYLDEMVFTLVLKGSRILYPKGKEIALNGISAKTNDCRNEAIKTLRRYKDKLTKKDLDLIGKAYDNEPNYELKEKLERLLYKGNNEKKENIIIDKLKIDEHVGDIYILSTNVAGSQFRSRRFLEEELEKSNLFYLQIEEDNPYDDRAIKIAGESGFVIGFISRCDNFILKNLLKGGKYLFCKIKEYDLEKNHIRIRVYLSYRDVIESINDTILMINGENTGGFIN